MTDDPPTSVPGVSGTTRTGTIKSGLISGLIAAAVVTLIAAAATVGGVDLEIGGEGIPLGGFPWWTIIGAAAGTITAVFVHDRRRFAVIALAATALSLVPALIAPDSNATRAVLVATHLAAAAIVIPALIRRKRH